MSKFAVFIVGSIVGSLITHIGWMNVADKMTTFISEVVVKISTIETKNKE